MYGAEYEYVRSAKYVVCTTRILCNLASVVRAATDDAANEEEGKGRGRGGKG